MKDNVLTYFFSCYFHQDWYHDYKSYDTAVKEFCNAESKEKVASVRRALEEAIVDECLPENFVISHGGYVRPEAFGLEMKDWLCRLVELMS